MSNSTNVGPALLALHDTQQQDVLVPLENIAAVFISHGSTQIILKEPRGAAYIAVVESPAEVQAIITRTINTMIAAVLQAYT